jgi:acetyl esterase
VFGSAHTHDRLVRELCAGTGAVVIFPNYDRSPEARYPTAIEQNYAVLTWISEHGAAAGIDPARIAVAGDSVGGNMAAVMTLLAKERSGPALVAQLLLYPVTDANFDTASYREFAEGFYLRRDGMQWFWDQYITGEKQRAEITASPLRATVEQLGGLPAALVITGEADVLRDEGEAYAAKLRRAGVPVTAVRYQGDRARLPDAELTARDVRRRGRHDSGHRVPEQGPRVLLSKTAAPADDGVRRAAGSTPPAFSNHQHRRQT